MKLSLAEFRAMNNPFRQALQKRYEFPSFQSLGLADQPGDVLALGCGSEYGAVLLASLHPCSYVGVDLMQEQIALAQKRGLDDVQFFVADAANLSQFPSESKDMVVIFGVLHHIPPWRKVIGECARVLRPGGHIFLEEPDNSLIDHCERAFHWGHPGADLSLPALEAFLVENGFKITGCKHAFSFGHYSAQKQDHAEDVV
jgi:ubiquinone/menaquinone biosynthesis C-methylase UbiE